MSDERAPSFLFPAVWRKKVTAAFDGRQLTPDGGMLLLVQADRWLDLRQSSPSVFPTEAPRAVSSMIEGSALKVR